jgi:hypothetical protein
MIALLAHLAVASGDYRVERMSASNADPVLVVVTPGFAIDGFLPLIRGLRADGYDVRVLEFDCAGQDAARLAADVAEAARGLDHPVVVAHGLGATLTLLAAPDLEAERLVLLAPVLDVVPAGTVAWLASLPHGAAVDFSAARGRVDHEDVARILLGDDAPPLTCAPGPFVDDVQGWIADADVPIAFASVDLPVWIGVSLGDDVATVEAVLPASRLLPDHTVVRLGRNRLDPRDYSHADLLMAAVPVRRALDAVRSGR